MIIFDTAWRQLCLYKCVGLRWRTEVCQEQLNRKSHLKVLILHQKGETQILVLCSKQIAEKESWDFAGHIFLEMAFPQHFKENPFCTKATSKAAAIRGSRMRQQKQAGGRTDRSARRCLLCQSLSNIPSFKHSVGHFPPGDFNKTELYTTPPCLLQALSLVGWLSGEWSWLRTGMCSHQGVRGASNQKLKGNRKHVPAWQQMVFKFWSSERQRGGREREGLAIEKRWQSSQSCSCFQRWIGEGHANFAMTAELNFNTIKEEEKEQNNSKYKFLWKSSFGWTWNCD